MSYKSEDHTRWKEEKSQRYYKKKRSKTNDSISPPKLSLSDKMKEVLVTKWKMKPNEIDDMLNDSFLN